MYFPGFDEHEDDSFIDVALICKNGHLINAGTKKYPQYNYKHCKECGAETISTCKHCNSQIDGEEHFDFAVDSNTIEVPKYCNHCGEPYPWTELKIKAAEEMIDLIDELEPNEKSDLKESAIVISTDNPRTKVGVLKVKKYVAKMGSFMGNALRDVLVDVASETAVRYMKELGM